MAGLNIPEEADIKADEMSQIKIRVSGAEHVLKITVCKSRYKIILMDFVFELRQKNNGEKKEDVYSSSRLRGLCVC